MWINPSKSLVDRALERWSATRLRADNTSVVTLMLDPPGPSRGEVLLSRKKERVPSPKPVPTLSNEQLIEKRQFVESQKIENNTAVAEPERLINPAWIADENNDRNIAKENSHVPLIESKISTSLNQHDRIDIKKSIDVISESSDLKNIQVAEISSTDTSVNHQNVDTSPEEPQLEKIMRQNAFSGSCDQLQCGPRLTRSCTGLPASMMLPAEPTVTTSPDPPRRRQHGCTLSSSILLNATRSELRSAKRRPNPTNLPIPVITSRVDTPQKIIVSPVVSRLDRTLDSVSSKRRHSSTFEAPEEPVCASQEPSNKRRTRSEDRPCPTDENNPVNQAQPQQQQQQQQSQHSRLYWPVACSMGSRLRNSATPTTTSCSTTINTQEKIPSPNSFQRRSLEKKATPVKTIRRPSINGSSRIQLRGSFALRDWDQAKSSSTTSLNHSVNGSSPDSVSSTPQRWLRSDTIAATPIKTLRSRNVDIAGHTVPPQIAHQYGIVKQNRISLPAKIKITNSTKVKSSPLTANKLKQTSVGNGVGTNGSANVSGIAKRVKSSPYNPSARSLGTRSRLKRLSK